MRYQFMRFPEGKSKAVTFSYDDGVTQEIRFSEILNKYKMKGTFNLNNQSLKRKNGLSKDEVIEYLLKKGHEIAVHGANHRANCNIRSIEGIQDVLNNRLELEETYGIIIRGMAYPDTGINKYANDANYEKVKTYLQELDITYARTLGGDNNSFEMPQDWYAWMPTAHHNNPQIFDYIEEFLNINLEDEKAYCARRQPRLFYLWGHSYEFDNNDNWDRIEQICERLSFKDNTWYATNMEIYEYVKAYHSLIYSADGTRIYNPTLHTIWFDRDRILYVIKPGETVKISE